MVDKIQDNDEYEFTDYDTISPDPMGRDDEVIERRTTEVHSTSGRSNVLRNALIAVALIIVALVVYKFVSSFFTKRTTSIDASIPSVTPSTDQTATTTTNGMTQPNGATSTITTPPITDTTQQTQPTDIAPIQTTTSSTSTTTTQTPTTVTTPPSPDISQLDQKVSALDINQQNIRSDIGTLSNQLTSINTNISNLNVKMDNLSQIITTLSATIERQTNQLTALTVVKKAPKIKRVVRRVIAPRTIYYIQAVIPGRAWLIASNGSTLTVREGTNIPGYGVVKLIDPNQGRVLTSSGQIIRFSQQDS
ncbi:protein IcmG (DotF) [Legionella beliardensis]|uniref:Protein IcmG (DotF) n=1 Tax=Legionella beliardensis TaxID=91822 RepID=A0A378HZH5_9GAMM|nr:type IVB secretion system protein IcmG/DotF [Legionella beliardensis]STX28152.1 protein IcmG (DotF) [Legionella beliardensis]